MLTGARDLPGIAEEVGTGLNTAGPVAAARPDPPACSQSWADWMDEDEEEEAAALEALRLEVEGFARRGRQTENQRESVAGGDGSASEVGGPSPSSFDTASLGGQSEGSTVGACDTASSAGQSGSSESSAFDAIPREWGCEASTSSSADAVPALEQGAASAWAVPGATESPSSEGSTLPYGEVLRRAARRFAGSGTGLCRPLSDQKGSRPSKLPRPSGRRLADPALSLPPLPERSSAAQWGGKRIRGGLPPRSKKAPTVARAPRLATAQRALDRQSRRKA